MEGAQHAVTRDEVVPEGSLAHDAKDGGLQLRLRNVQLVAVNQLLLDVQCNLDGGVIRYLRSKASAQALQRRCAPLRVYLCCSERAH